MDEIDINTFIGLVESNDCIWKNETVNAENLAVIESAWVSVAYAIYENFEELKENQKRFWVNNLKRKWKLITNKFKTLGSEYEKFELLKFLIRPEVSIDATSDCDLTERRVFETESNQIPSLDINHTKVIKCGEILFDSEAYSFKCFLCDSLSYSLGSLEVHFTNNHHLPTFACSSKSEIKNEQISNIENIEYLIEEECTDGVIKLENESESFCKESQGEVLIKDLIYDGSAKKFEGNDETTLFKTNMTEYYQELSDENEIHEESHLFEEDNESNEQQSIECSHCNVVFDMKIGHDIEKCFAVQERIRKLNGDLRRLRDEGIFHCDRCPRYFVSADKMHSHRREEHYEICPVCKIRLLNVKNHVVQRHPEIDCNRLKIPDSFISGKFECKLCDKEFVQDDEWLRHKDRCCNTDVLENRKKAFKIF